MKVIFLDFDGPLISHRARSLTTSGLLSWKEYVSELPDPVSAGLLGDDPWNVFIPRFDPVAVVQLQKLVLGHQALIVISSSWRKLGKRNIEAILEQNEISPRWLHAKWCTEPSGETIRKVDEIMLWLNQASERGEEISAYAAIDDDPSILELPGGVLVAYADGFRWGDFCSVSAALGGGISTKNFRVEAGNLVADVSPGRLGEMVVQRFGNTPKKFNFGPIEISPNIAPAGCVRCLDSPYQLVRLAETDGIEVRLLKWKH